MNRKKKSFTKEALFKARDIKHIYSETFVKPMDPCAKSENA
jgi:hypothetical protein